MITSPIKRHLTSLSKGFSATQTKLLILRSKVKGSTEAAEQSKKNPRAGMSVAQLHTHTLTTEGIHAQLATTEASRAAKKHKPRGKRAQAAR